MTRIEQHLSNLIGLYNNFHQDYCSNVFLKLTENNSSSKEPHSFLYFIITKILMALKSSNELLPLYFKKKYTRVSNRLILRSVIHDLVLVEFIDQSSRKGDDFVESLIERFYGNHIIKAFEDLDSNQKVIKGRSESEVEDIKTQLKELNPQYFNAEGELKITYQTDSPTSLIRTMLSEHKPYINKSELVSYYELFEYFSKSEHIGVITHNQILKSNDSNLDNTDLIRIFGTYNIGIKKSNDIALKYWANHINENEIKNYSTDSEKLYTSFKALNNNAK